MQREKHVFCNLSLYIRLCYAILKYVYGIYTIVMVRENNKNIQSFIHSFIWQTLPDTGGGGGGGGGIQIQGCY